MKTPHNPKNIDFNQLAQDIKTWGKEVGFQQVGITDTDLSAYENDLREWLKKGYHGKLNYMERYGMMRARPSELVPGTLRIISVRMNYLPPHPDFAKVLNNPEKAFVSRYALGRDYHKLMRKRLEKLAQKITTVVGDFGYRAFTDSAPIMEKPIAAKAGLGWQGKHTNLINREAGSYFFIGELFTDLPLPIDAPVKNHCGSCQACIDICPTQAIIGAHQIDARRCISYLTIELREAIPEEFRKKIGNRIYGCDDCQMVCPWNRFAKTTDELDFYPRHQLNASSLIELFSWTEEEFLQKTEGSAIRRIGYDSWMRNIAVALGNTPTSDSVVHILKKRYAGASPLVQEHITWALKQHGFNPT